MISLFDCSMNKLFLSTFTNRVITKLKIICIFDYPEGVTDIEVIE